MIIHKLKQFFHISNYLKIYTHIFDIYLMCGEGVQTWCPCRGQKTAFWSWELSFCWVRSGLRTQVSKLFSKHLYPLSHLVSCDLEVLASCLVLLNKLLLEDTSFWVSFLPKGPSWVVLGRSPHGFLEEGVPHWSESLMQSDI